jgi:hypothetical protein
MFGDFFDRITESLVVIDNTGWEPEVIYDDGNDDVVIIIN